MVATVNKDAGEKIAKLVIKNPNAITDEHMRELFHEPEDKSKPESNLMLRVQIYFESSHFDLDAFNKFATGHQMSAIPPRTPWPALDQDGKGNVGCFTAKQNLLWFGETDMPED